jgi:hypothetical protein
MNKKKIIIFFITSSLFLAATTLVSVAADNMKYPSTGLPDSQGGIKPILERLLLWLLSIVGMIAVISFVVSGLQYFISAGDEDQMTVVTDF